MQAQPRHAGTSGQSPHRNVVSEQAGGRGLSLRSAGNAGRDSVGFIKCSGSSREASLPSHEWNVPKERLPACRSCQGRTPELSLSTRRCVELPSGPGPGSAQSCTGQTQVSWIPQEGLSLLSSAAVEYTHPHTHNHAYMHHICAWTHMHRDPC